MSKSVVLIASGDLRLSANRVCWPAQEAAEAAVTKAVNRFGWEVKRGHPFDQTKQHGFIDSQKYGMAVFQNIPQDAPLIVVEAVWQYSHHVLARFDDTSRADSDCGELERAVAGLGGHVEPQRLAD